MAVSVSNDDIELVVFTIGEGWQNWRFDLGADELHVTATEPLIPARESNPLPTGGIGAPLLSRPPFEQRLLPTGLTDGEWAIAALTDAAGRVLVIEGDEAHWMSGKEWSSSE